MTSPAAFIDKYQRRCDLIAEVIEALEIARDAVTVGPIYWGDGEYTSKRKLLDELGIKLVTKTALEKRGHRVKRGATPVGTVHFPAPIQRHCAVYILGVQTTERP